MKNLGKNIKIDFNKQIKDIESEMIILSDNVDSKWEILDRNKYVEISDMIRGLKILVDGLDWSIDINQFDFEISNEIRLSNGDTITYSHSYYDGHLVVYEYQYENETFEIKLDRKNIIDNVFNGIDIKDFIDTQILYDL